MLYGIEREGKEGGGIEGGGIEGEKERENEREKEKVERRRLGSELIKIEIKKNRENDVE